jgi:hypothetical protein
MKSLFLRFSLLLGVWFFTGIFQAQAQCAMCRASVESNMSEGQASIGAGINTGILYLLAMPYLAIGLVTYLWYRNSKKQYAYIQGKSNFRRKMSSL